MLRYDVLIYKVIGSYCDMKRTSYRGIASREVVQSAMFRVSSSEYAQTNKGCPLRGTHNWLCVKDLPVTAARCRNKFDTSTLFIHTPIALYPCIIVFQGCLFERERKRESKRERAKER